MNDRVAEQLVMTLLSYAHRGPATDADVAMCEQTAVGIRETFAELDLAIDDVAERPIMLAVLGATAVVLDNLVHALGQIPADADRAGVERYLERVIGNVSATMLAATGGEFIRRPADGDVQAAFAERLRQRAAAAELEDLDTDEVAP